MNDLCYYIDEIYRVVWVGKKEDVKCLGAKLTFNEIQRYRDRLLIDPQVCPSERGELYLIASDELIERGLIEDRS